MEWGKPRPMWAGGPGAIFVALAAALWMAGAIGAAEPAEVPVRPDAAAHPEAAARPEAAKSDVDSAALRDFLLGPDRTLSTRRDAAEALLDKDTPESRAVLVQVLVGPMPLDVTLAVLEALAARDKAGGEFIEPLFALLRSDDDAVRRAAAAAFGAYPGDDRVLGRLTQLASSAETPQAQRLAAVQAMSQLIDKRVIGELVRLTADPKPAVAAAADDALADMTGLKDLGQAPRPGPSGGRNTSRTPRPCSWPACCGSPAKTPGGAKLSWNASRPASSAT